MDYIIRQLLTDAEVSEIRKHIIDERNIWLPGMMADGPSIEKKNLEMQPNSTHYEIIRKTIFNAIDKDEKFIRYVLPSSSTAIIISKYLAGGFYDIHFDDPTSGSFSTTVFLSEPDTYEGGELSLFINEKEEKFKLQAGWAITYKTGLLHKVNEVRSGERCVGVFWSESYCKDPFLADIYYEIEEARDVLNQLLVKHNIRIDGDWKDLETYKREPKLMLKNISHKILRKIL